ncbi:D-alanine--D-alanine ligase [Candidatus Uhrbacteria bacterium]|nr:D-alanine--D-alanine ligase [Candidatus Uhrbacteria bacterium]
MQKINVGVMFGGRSAEHEISLLSAYNVIAAIPKNKYNIVPIGVRKDGSYVYFPKGDFILHPGDAKKVRLSGGGVSVTFAFGEGRHLASLKGTGVDKRIDVVFPVLHGTYGEDGTMQGLLSLADIPFVGPGVLGSAVGMDKDVAKRLWRDAGLPMADFLPFRKSDLKKIQFQAIVRKLGLPFFIKPAVAGSSVGVHKVKSAKQFAVALRDAFSYSDKVLIEQMIVGKEIECSVLGNERPVVSLPGAVIPTHSFYSYEAKYLDEHGAHFEIPAALPRKVVQKIQRIVLDAFKVLELEGMARVDGFLTSKGEFILNEVNTIPGFTKISMYPKLWEVSGVSYPELIDRLLQLAIERHKRERQLKTARL